MVNILINNPSMYVFRKGFMSQNSPSYTANYATRSNEHWRRPNRRELEAEVLIEIYWDMHAKEKLQVPTDDPLNCVCMGLRPISSEGYHFTKCRLKTVMFSECSLDKTCFVIISLKSIDLKYCIKNMIWCTD